MEYDRLITLIGTKQPPEAGIKVRWRGGGGVSLAQRRDFIQQLLSLSADAQAPPLELNPKEFQGFQLALPNEVLHPSSTTPPLLHLLLYPPHLLSPQALKPQSFRNPYDIPRSQLLDQLSRMRRNLLNTGVCLLRGQDSGEHTCNTEDR